MVCCLIGERREGADVMELMDDGGIKGYRDLTVRERVRAFLVYGDLC